MNPAAPAASAAARTSSMGASGRPYAMFSRIEIENKKGSSRTTPMLARRLVRVMSRTSCPSTRTVPPVAS